MIFYVVQAQPKQLDLIQVIDFRGSHEFINRARKIKSELSSFSLQLVVPDIFCCFLGYNSVSHGGLPDLLHGS